MFRLTKPLVLGSQSPRRADILKMLGIPFTVDSPDFEETKEDWIRGPLELAEKKALSLLPKYEHHLLLCCDTMVFLDFQPLGKPGDKQEALQMLGRLNHRQHTVVSAVVLACDGKITGRGEATTTVNFRRSPNALLNAYVRTGEPLDKAGSYGIQGMGAALVERIEGCFYNVMGLPLHETLKLLDPYCEYE